MVRAEDDGPGIADIERALEDGYSTGRGLGLGLPGARRLMDRLIVESAPGQGHRRRNVEMDPATCDESRAGSDPSSGPWRRRPLPGETRVRRPADRGRRRRRLPRCSAWSTDSATAKRPPPRPLRAAEVLDRSPASPSTCCFSCATARWPSTRGAAMTLARIDFDADTLSWIGVGNVTADLVAKVAER